MFRTLLAIAVNTFTQAIRQPVYGVIIGMTILIYIFSPSLSMFTIDDDNLLLRDIGLSTLLVSGLFLAVFSAATVVTDEIENKTVLTLISKTVSRAVFIIGKFIGISFAVILAQYLLTLVLLTMVRQGVMQTASDESDMVAMTLSIGTGILTALTCLGGSYFYQWRFSSTLVTTATLLMTIVCTLLYFLDRNWAFNANGHNLEISLLGPVLLTLFSVLILTAIATALSTRFNTVVTLLVSGAMFVMGVSLQYWLSPIITGGPEILKVASWIALTIVPSLNEFIVTNAIYNETTVSLSYICKVGLYACTYITGTLMFAIALFRARDIG